MQAAILGRLAADTEAIGFFTGSGRSSFVYLKDGEGVEAFEPGHPQTLRGREPYAFWTATGKIIERTSRTVPMPPALATLQAITKHVRGTLDRSALEGPLLTAFLSDSGRELSAPLFDDRSERAARSAGQRAAAPDATGVPTPPAWTRPSSWDGGGTARVS